MSRSVPTAASAQVRAALDQHADEIAAILARYAATDPRLFGSVARGEAKNDSDVDILVQLTPGAGNPLLRVSGIAEEMSRLLGTKVDVVAPELLRDVVSAAATAESVAV
jgi:predicted nucleotidyltransferase